ncbi:hypothetical protein [Paraburkholderia sp. BR10882]|uniref:SpaN/EivJ family type III secretion system needle length determinant n=1 Tax=unclassified Paraburkholderia TaxID=2615204 RepID=UPI0034CD9EAD
MPINSINDSCTVAEPSRSECPSQPVSDAYAAAYQKIHDNTIHDGCAIATPWGAELTLQAARGVSGASTYQKTHRNMRLDDDFADLWEIGASRKKKKTPDPRHGNLFIPPTQQWSERSAVASSKSAAGSAAGELAPVLTANSPPLPVYVKEPSCETDRGASRTARANAVGMVFATDCIHPTGGFSLHYRFKSWHGQPAVDLRFERKGAEFVVAAATKHARVTDTMQHHADALPSEWTLRFERKQLDSQDKRPLWPVQQQEADEQ